MRPLVRTAREESLSLIMSNTLKIFQLNAGKRRPVQESIMNDEQLRDFSALAISEPWIWRIDNELVPKGYSNWTRVLPTLQNEGRWAVRSMLWIRKDIEHEQVPIQSADLTAAVLHVVDRHVMVVSIYIEPGGERGLVESLEILDNVIKKARERIGEQLEVALIGDFNRHDKLWGGSDMGDRQGEADQLIEFMNQHSLQSLLQRGTKTWHNSSSESTIDLVLVSEELASNTVKCKIHDTNHGSDHEAIEMMFGITVPEQACEERLLFRNAPWKKICDVITAKLAMIPVRSDVQEQTNQLMSVVSETVHMLTPRAKPTPYAKRWWTSDLTRLRKEYTQRRNRARNLRGTGIRDRVLETLTKEASKQYHDAIRKQKKDHWNEFLEDDANTWQAAKYMSPNRGSSFDKVPPL